MPKFIAARVGRDRTDVHVAGDPLQALCIANPDRGAAIEFIEVEAQEPEEARHAVMRGKGHRLTRLTYGCMPREDVYRAMFEHACGDGDFAFRNDPRVGSDKLSVDELWTAMCAAIADSESWAGHEDAEKAQQWVGDVLSVLGIEWV